MVKQFNSFTATLCGTALVVASTSAFADDNKNPKSATYTQTATVVSADGTPMETYNRTVFILEGKRQRTEHQLGVIDIADGVTGQSVSIHPDAKRFVRHTKHLAFDPETGKQKERDLTQPPKRAVDYYASILSTPGQDAEQLGEQTIDGRAARGLRTITTSKHGTSARTFWIDKQTNLPLQIEIEYQPKDDASKQITVMSRFRFDVPLDTAMFSTEPPAGFKIEEQPIYSIQLK